MKLIHRLGFYFGGFSIGLVFLMFFLSGKKTSCAYGPNARVLKNINSKSLIFSDKVQSVMSESVEDSMAVFNLLKYGEVLFGESNTKPDSCKIYTIKQDQYKIVVENCDSTALIQTLQKKF